MHHQLNLKQLSKIIKTMKWFPKGNYVNVLQQKKTKKTKQNPTTSSSSNNNRVLWHHKNYLKIWTIAHGNLCHNKFVNKTLFCYLLYWKNTLGWIQTKGRIHLTNPISVSIFHNGTFPNLLPIHTPPTLTKIGFRGWENPRTACRGIFPSGKLTCLHR